MEKHLHPQDLLWQQQRSCLLTNRSGNWEFILLYTLVIACRPGRYSRDTNHSSPWPLTIYAQYAHTTHFITYMLFFGVQTAQTLKIHVIRDVTICRCINSSWHFKDTTILQNIGNYIRSDSNIPKIWIFSSCAARNSNLNEYTLILLTLGLLTGYKMYPGALFSSTVLSSTEFFC